jgi:hypothetical protein
MNKCQLKEPVECWQYTPNETSLPLWALPFCSVEEGTLTFTKAEEEIMIEHTDWLVWICDDEVLVYSEAEFRKSFKVIP